MISLYLILYHSNTLFCNELVYFCLQILFIAFPLMEHLTVYRIVIQHWKLDLLLLLIPIDITQALQLYLLLLIPTTIYNHALFNLFLAPISHGRFLVYFTIMHLNCLLIKLPRYLSHCHWYLHSWPHHIAHLIFIIYLIHLTLSIMHSLNEYLINLTNHFTLLVFLVLIY